MSDRQARDERRLKMAQKAPRVGLRWLQIPSGQFPARISPILWGDYIDKLQYSPYNSISMNEVGQSALESITQSCCPGLTAAARSAARRWAGVFKALADPTRLQILSLVAKNEGGVCECHIVACTPLSQPTISYHVKILKEAGLLACEKRGLWCYYALRKDVLRQAAAALEEMGRVADFSNAGGA